MVTRLGRLLAVLAVLALVAAACGDSDDDTASDGDASGSASAPADGDTTTTASDDGATTTAAGDEGDGDTTTTASDDGGSSGPTAGGVDIDAALAADLDDCVEAPSGEPIRVGMAMDFGEVSGFADIPGSQAVEHMAELVNCIGGVDDRPVDVQVQDIQGDPEVTTRATQDLIDFGAHFLIGPPFADFGQPILQVTEGGIPVFFAASTEPSLPDIGALSFLVTFDDTKQATAAAEYALEQGWTRAITFSSPGPYFGYNPEIFTEVFEGGGGEVVSDQNYVPVEDVDFSAQVNEISGLAEGDEVIYSAMLAFQVTALRGQLEAQGLTDLVYIGTDAFEATGLLFEDDIEGIIHTTHAFIEPGGRIDQLLQSYEATTGEALESGTFAGLYVDSMLLGIQGMLDSGSDDPAEIGAAVAEIDGFEGFTGEMGYVGTNGVPDKPVSIHEVVDGMDTLAADWE